MSYGDYTKEIDKNLEIAYSLANKCRAKGFDPELKVETLLAQNMVERVVGLISVVAPQIAGTKIVDRVHELEKSYGAQDWRVALTAALEVAQENFCKFKDKLEAMEVGIRVGIAYVTNGVVASPLEGFTELKIRKRRDEKEYFALYFSGPIRSAGGTGASVSVLIGDYIRKNMGYEAYDPSEQEINRLVTELYDYHDRVTNLQYLPSEDEIRFMVSNLPVQIDGDPSEKYDVSNYKGLDRIETDRIRNGPCLVIGEGLCQKAPKLMKNLAKWGKEMRMDHWFFIDDFLKLQKQIKSKQAGAMTTSDEKIKPDFTFIKDLVAGRPVFTHPLRRGGFRLRYGRGRNSGFSCQAIHPATMFIVKKFIAIGTQLKVERPGKSSVVGACDDLEGPVVKLTNGDVLYVEDANEAKKIANDVVEILHLGDLLINYGDFLNRNHTLVPAGYCEEWWSLELKKAAEGKDTGELKKIIDTLIERPSTRIDAAVAIELSKRFGVPFHPRYTFRWLEIAPEQLTQLNEWYQKASVEDRKVIFPLNPENLVLKRILEVIGVPHRCVAEEYVVVEGDWAEALKFSLENADLSKKDALEMLNPKVVFRDKQGTAIGARMGRPEKAKMRKLTGSPNILFPVGDEGGRMRCFESCLEKKHITAQFPLFYCEKCNKEAVYGICECGSPTVLRYYCKTCGKVNKTKCHPDAVPYQMRKLEINPLFNHALKISGLRQAPELIKGVRGTSNKDHVLEHLTKGLIRAKYNLYVNKDGTIRYDMTEMPLTHFKPKEVMTPIERLRELGYTMDIHGNELKDGDQILELKMQDVVLPCSDESLEEGSKDVFFKTSKFIDELIALLYNEKPYYNLKTAEDVVGHYVVGLAPHISAGIVGRVIGFSKTQGFLAHPCFHSIMRRDCVYPTTKLMFRDERDEFHYEPIGKFVDSLIDRGCKSKAIDGVGTRSVIPDRKYYTYGADPITKALVKKNIKYFIKGPKEKVWVKVRTATNREIIMTPNHDFMHIDDQYSIKFKKARDIEAGDKLLVMDYLPYTKKDPEPVDIIREFIAKLPDDVKPKFRVVGCSDFFKALVKKAGRKQIEAIISPEQHLKNLSQWYRAVPLHHLRRLLEESVMNHEDIPAQAEIKYWFSSKPFHRYLQIDRDLCRLLGYYTAEGHCRENKTTRQVSLRVCNRDLIPVIAGLIKKVCVVDPILEEDDTKITIAHAMFYYLFKYVFDTGVNAHSKKVPSFMYALRDEFVLEYLASYIEGDATITPERTVICMYSTSRSLLDDMALLLSRFSVIGRFFTTKERLPGRKIIDRYKELGLQPKKFRLHHFTITGQDCIEIASKLRLRHPGKEREREQIIAKTIDTRTLKVGGHYLPVHSFGDSFIDYVKDVEIVESEAHSYCVEVDWKRKEERSVLWGEQILNTRCDGDEACVILLMDMLLNFSRRYLPDHRGARQDAPLVLTSKILPSEVDDMVFDMDVAWRYPLELYEAAQQYKNPNEVKIERLKDRLGTPGEYEGYGFTHNTDDINGGVRYSAYKSLPTMEDKVMGQMDLANRIRAVDKFDVAKQVIERHFIRDIRGNLRKFSTQQFRCVKCNEKYRRPPLVGRCLKCEGHIIFTISEGSIVKYLEPSLSLAEKYDLSPYLRQSLEITKRRIESIFGKEAEKQEGLGKWFG